MIDYVLCEALYCHAGKFQVRFFLREMTNYLLCVNPVKTGIMVAV